MIDIDELISVIEQLQKVGRISIIDDAVGAIKKLVAENATLKAKLESARKCGSCGDVLSRDCSRCERLWQS